MKATKKLEKLASKDILDTLRAWQNEAHVINPEVLLKALRGLRKGDFKVRLPENQIGIAGEIAKAFNESVELNQLMLKEFERVGKATSRDGKISQRVSINTATGSWANYVDAFNTTIDGFVEPINEYGRVISSVGKGDLTESMSLSIEGKPLKGEFLQFAKNTNNVLNLLNDVSTELTRVALDVGTEGILGGQAKVKGASGAWLELTNNVNLMASNLTTQVRNIAEVTTAVANGNLDRKITADVKGEILELKNTVNSMVDQLRDFSSEVTRIATEVGTDGILGGQAKVRNVSGVWLELTNTVNVLTDNLTNQVRDIAKITTAVSNGDLEQKITIEAKGEVLTLKDTVNAMVDQLNIFANEVTTVAREVGTEGKLGVQANVKGASGIWSDLTNNVNTLANNLTTQVRDIAKVTSAVAMGDLDKKITVDAKGEILDLKNTINTMVDQLGIFSFEVSNVAKEVGTEGKLGGQAKIDNAGGVWLSLTQNVNTMANSLTSQVRDISNVASSVANGDLEQKITVEAKGEVALLKNTINDMVDNLNLFSNEVTRVALDVGTEGQLGGQAVVKGVSGTWQDLTTNVNAMASNLTSQVRDIAKVATAVANGDLEQKITVDAKGEILELKGTINLMVDKLSQFSTEVTRVAVEVGTEGKLGGQAEVKDVSGVWQALTTNVNLMADNLTLQVRDISKVATAVAQGRLDEKITVEVNGEIDQLKNTINNMVDQLSEFSFEVTKVALDVGTEGKLGGQAEVKGVSGVWEELTNNVNEMASNLTLQVRDIAKVTTAVANGDLDQKITVEVKGEIGELKNIINTMVDKLGLFSTEVSRVAQEVGTDGKLGGQAKVKNVSGIWELLTNNVNAMADNLTEQVRNIALVSSAIADGDLSQKIKVDAKGEVLDLKRTINTMVDRLSLFSSEVTRVAQEVGSDGILGGQAEIEGVTGVWKDLSSNVNVMASNLTSQVRDIALVTTAVANGDLSKKITVEVKGEVLQLKDTINLMVDQLSEFSVEVTRVAREVGTEGKLGGKAEVKGVSGVWGDLTDNVNLMCSNLTEQVRDITQVTTAVANGDLDQRMTVDAQGEISDLKITLNTMVGQLNQFSSEVTRVAKEVGTDGLLGGQAEVKGVSGVWKDLTDNVNGLANNLTNQVRNITEVTKAVSVGDLTRKITVDAKGEVLDLKNTINSMTDMLFSFSEQVTNVALEVGTEGNLGGKAEVQGVQGAWKDLTDNVNELANNLTRQVRAIIEVVTGVTRGELDGSISVEAKGEVNLLKNNINQMIRTLKSTTDSNDEQNWLKTNLTKFNELMQRSNSLPKLSQSLVAELCSLLSAQHGAFYIFENSEGGKQKNPELRLLTGYAFKERKQVANVFRLGEGLIGQCALEKERILLVDVPSDYVKINSGLGEATPNTIVVLPIQFDDQLIGVIELASFKTFTSNEINFLDQLMLSVGVISNGVIVSARTANLLKESQSMSEELQSQQEELQESNSKLEDQAKTLKRSENKLKIQQEELQQTNEELEEKSEILTKQKLEVDIKNEEVSQAKTALESQAAQLALTSKYKSEFLANMSHELRTPLNSLLILSEGLSKNREKNLNAKQIQKAKTIYNSGVELLDLINEILDLAKIESGKMSIDIGDIFFAQFKEWTVQSFEQIAVNKSLQFAVNLHKNLPKSMRTDKKRLQQIVKNLLSNAFKFTAKGSVNLNVSKVISGWSTDNESLNQASSVIAFSVVDTGIGIPEDKHQIIFEAFQQADGTTSRKYGGTGLGLSITRDIANMLGGEVTIWSNVGQGSTFTFFVPLNYKRKETPDDNNDSNKSNDIDNRAIDGDFEVVSKGTEERSSLIQDNQTDGLSQVVAPEENELSDDRLTIVDNDRVILIIEDDLKFAQILLDMTREQGFKGIVAVRGDSGFSYAQQYKPDAIILDINLPIMNGWTVLDRIKHEPELRHIPVHIASIDDVRKRSIKSGALSFLKKPVVKGQLNQVFKDINEFHQRDISKLLIVEDDDVQRNALIDLIEEKDVKIVAVDNVTSALEKLNSEHFDCMVLDLMLPNINGFEFIETIKKIPKLINLPIIIYTGKELSKKEETQLKSIAETIIIKGVKSSERLLDETALFLHRVEKKLPEHKREILQQVHDCDPALKDRKVLIVDDDVRNIYTLSTIFEDHQSVIFFAESGMQALTVLKENPDIEIVLMDIMMPEMDGYETMRAIRKIKRFKALPIIAVTAKAMKEDRQKCIDAGASDYMTKPINTDQLLSLVRVWLYK